MNTLAATAATVAAPPTPLAERLRGVADALLPAAAALLITVLVQRARNRRAGDRALPVSLA